MSEPGGLPTRALESPYLRLEFLTQAGPRLVRLGLAGRDENLLAELPGLTIATPLGAYSLRGGHRLWHAPEAMPRSYVPDDAGLAIEEVPEGVRLRQPVEALTGIRKTMTVRLAPDRPVVTVDHELRNEGPWPVELAPWAITQLPLGGIAILPQRAGALDPTGLLPNRQLVLWPYTHLQDPRLHLGDDLLLLRAEPAVPPCKIGYLNRLGWAAYLHRGVLLVKRFSPRPEEPHADFGCNVETYCNDQFLELETLGPLARLAPGEAVSHTETWELHLTAEGAPTIDAVRRLVRELRLPQ